MSGELYEKCDCPPSVLGQLNCQRCRGVGFFPIGLTAAQAAKMAEHMTRLDVRRGDPVQIRTRGKNNLALGIVSHVDAGAAIVLIVNPETGDTSMAIVPVASAVRVGVASLLRWPDGSPVQESRRTG